MSLNFNVPQWLKNYYGDELLDFNPIVIFEGVNRAVVKISKTVQGHPSTGYVLLKKNGSSHSHSEWVSLCEGSATQEQLIKMQEYLNKNDN